MIFPITVTFRGIPPSQALEAKVRQKAEKLARFNPRIIGCHVVVDAPHRHRTKGESFAVHVRLTLPRQEVVVSHDHGEVIEHDDPYVAIRDAFGAIRRRLEDRTRRARGDVKLHRSPLLGRVIRVDPGDGWGFVETTDGLQVYFHENAVVGGKIGDLRVGSEVRVVWTDGHDGPQASTVEPIGKHHVTPSHRPAPEG